MAPMDRSPDICRAVQRSIRRKTSDEPALVFLMTFPNFSRCIANYEAWLPNVNLSNCSTKPTVAVDPS